MDDTLSIFQIDPNTEQVVGNSFSGGERNRLFINRNGQFKDASLVSGIDYKQDGRGFAISDFDNDGLLELCIVSNQNPRVRIVKLAEKQNPDTSRFVKIRLSGGNRSTEPDETLSTRDAVGATVLVKTAQTDRLFQISGGEGFSVQNSRTLHVGMGNEQRIDQLEIRWPSGKTTVMKDIRSGSEIDVSEPPN